jgi:hypothetical protein
MYNLKLPLLNLNNPSTCPLLSSKMYTTKGRLACPANIPGIKFTIRRKGDRIAIIKEKLYCHQFQDFNSTRHGPTSLSVPAETTALPAPPNAHHHNF